MSLQTPDVVSVWGPTQFLSAVPRRGGQRNVGITTKLSNVAVNLTVLLCAKVRNSSRRDGSGTAKRGNSHDSRLQAEPVPPSAGPLYL